MGSGSAVDGKGVFLFLVIVPGGTTTFSVGFSIIN